MRASCPERTTSEPPLLWISGENDRYLDAVYIISNAEQGSASLTYGSINRRQLRDVNNA